MYKRVYLILRNVVKKVLLGYNNIITVIFNGQV